MIKLINATKNFSKTRGIDKINLTIDKGQIVGLLGPNGAGKTTMIRSIVGDYYLDEGEIIIEGLKTREERIKKIAYMPSESNFPSTKLYNIIRIFEMTLEDFSSETMDFLLSKFKLDIFEQFKNLSKGQRKAFHLSLILSRDCDLYVLDEPLSGIDPVYRKMITDEILNSINTEEKLILISSHELNEIDGILDSVIIMRTAEIEGHYDIDEVRETCNLYDWYIEKFI